MFPQKYTSYCTELKTRLLKILVVWSIGAGICYYFVDTLLFLFLKPLLGENTVAPKIVFTGLADAFLMHIEIAFLTSVLLIFPLVQWQVWKFFSPALYAREKKLVKYLFLTSPLLFFIGVLFCYLLILPISIQFFLSYQKTSAKFSLEFLPVLSNYIQMVTKFMLAFGLSFQFPLILLSLCYFKIISPDSLANARRFIIVIIFCFAAIFTPPDVLSQIALATPLLLCYEGCILIAKKFK